MDKSRYIVGLDIGTTKVCAVVGELSESGLLDVVGVGESVSTGLRKGIVVNIDQTVNSIRQAVEAAELMAGCEIKSVYVGIAGSHIMGINSHGVIAIKGNEVSQRDIDRALEAAQVVAIPADRDVIHILPQEFIVDNQRGILDPLGMSGVRLEAKVHIVTGAVASAQNIIQSCRRSHLDVANFALESIASAKAVLTDEERELGVALVDIGGGTTDIAIFSNESIKHTAVIALGGEIITKDIAYILRTPIATAEEIKVKHGCVIPSDVDPREVIELTTLGGREPLKRQQLAEFIEPRMEEILYLVDQALVRSGYKDMLHAGIVLTGGTALIEGCQKLASDIFGRSTRIGYPRNVGRLKDMTNKPEYATAVGLLRYGVEQEMSGKKTFAPAHSVENSFFDDILDRMKKWFSDVS